MQDFPIHPALIVKDTPTPRRLHSIAEARAYVDDGMRLGRPPPWREIYHRLGRVRSEDGAMEAIGALRELLELQDLLVLPKLPLYRPTVA
jgi:hypothetical protein